MTDECIKKYKHHYPIMSYKERKIIVEALKDVFMVVPQDTFEFAKNLKKKHGIDIIFDSISDKRKGSDMFFMYDDSISSTIIKERILEASRSREK